MTTAEQAIGEVIRSLRKGAYDLAYTAPEMWIERVSEIMERTFRVAERYDGAKDIEYKLEVADRFHNPEATP